MVYMKNIHRQIYVKDANETYVSGQLHLGKIHIIKKIINFQKLVQ